MAAALQAHVQERGGRDAADRAHVFLPAGAPAVHDRQDYARPFACGHQLWCFWRVYVALGCLLWQEYPLHLWHEYPLHCGKSIHFIVARVSTSLWHEYPLSLLCSYPYPLHSSHPRFPPILPLFKHPTMGVILDKPVVDKEVTLFSQSEHKGAVVSMQGYRVSMEVDLSLQSVYAIGRVCCCAVDGV